MRYATNRNNTWAFFTETEGVWYHNLESGDQFSVTHSSNTPWSFCKLQGPFAKDNIGELHISFPKDIRHPDLKRYFLPSEYIAYGVIV